MSAHGIKIIRINAARARLTQMQDAGAFALRECHLEYQSTERCIFAGLLFQIMHP
jgi:hypothetical protein